MNAALLMVGTLGLLAGFGAGAEELPAPYDSVEARAVWIDTGFATRHFSHSRTLNGANRGLGIEYGLREDLAFTGGRFYNSSRNWSNYAGVLWQPLSYGRWRLGAVAVAMHGYPRMRHGGWFPAVIPAASYEFERVGLNIGIVPSYRDRLHGGISLQLKFKVRN
ncbi:MAG: hypothetical protein ACJ8HI_17965 [Massilia sp.]